MDMFAFHVVSKRPWVIHGYTFGPGLFLVRRLAPFLHPMKNEHIHFILTQDWHLTPKRLIGFKYDYEKFIKKYPYIKITILANEKCELEILKKNNINSILCSQNAFLDENKYIICDDIKKYDAVINSRMASYKRIELAKYVNTCLITYIYTKTDFDYSKTIIPLKNIYIPQFDGSTWKIYDTDQICEIYAQSRCGLILSAEEGACFAATEYLLCGLPVVTTPSVGGREAFFDPDYVVWTEPTPEAVAEAVQKAISLPISPQEIRERTIAKMKKVRETYCDLLSDLAREDGIERDFRSEWDSFFVNKMMAFGSDSDAEAVKYLREQGMELNYSLLNRLHTAHRIFRIWWDHLRGKR
jgi:glycosyltransferase involved in cell wall biosynthesis